MSRIMHISRLLYLSLSLLLLTAQSSFAQENSSAAQPAEVTAVANPENADESANSTVVYSSDFFSQYNPVTANDMLDRIPGISLGGGGPGGRGGGRGLGTGGNLLINGQRIAGKGNSARDQLDRITAAEVERIEIIRDTTGALNVRGASEVINVILLASQSRSSTTVELVNRLNHDDTLETGGSVAWSQQVGNFQALVNLEARPNYENRDNREVRLGPNNELVGTLFETNIRDQQEQTLSTNMSYSLGAHRMQLNALISEGDHPRPVRRDFVDFTDAGLVNRIEEEDVNREESNWEVGGDYEFSFEDGSRLSVLFVANDEIRNSVRERYSANPAEAGLSKNLFIDSRQERKEFIVQGNYNFSLTDAQSLRVGIESADTQLESSLLIGSSFGSEPPSASVGGLSPLLSVSNPGTKVQEIRYEGFAFHNWTLSDRSSLESSLVYETSEISQTGAVSKTRDFQFWRPSFDYRFNIRENFRFRGTIKRSVSQLSFSSFAATTNEEDRDLNALAGNPELEPQTSWDYEGQLEYRLPNDGGVISSSISYSDIDNYIGRINATIDPNEPLSATGNVAPAKRWAMFNRASIRLNKLNLPNAIFGMTVGLFDSEIIDPFLKTKQRIGGRGFVGINFRHDITSLGLSYGIDYSHSIWGGNYDIDIKTITRNDRERSLDLFVSKVWFEDWTFRLESDNTLDASRCRYRQRFNGTTIDGDISLIQDSCSSRYRRLNLSIQTTF
ncbi:MAG: TonB-dependent receptor plug domain-containing protein [Gammaproteobacteria bacterium]|nr:TonB-dependent receptor plug domain-containing protein [Gammaproteobacteria bacterium]MDG2337124.1 TonB-dependent receptor plug domain-containing protein [Gammaproteobacteria bacterium]